MSPLKNLAFVTAALHDAEEERGDYSGGDSASEEGGAVESDYSSEEDSRFRHSDAPIDAGTLQAAQVFSIASILNISRVLTTCGLLLPTGPPGLCSTIEWAVLGKRNQSTHIQLGRVG